MRIEDLKKNECIMCSTQEEYSAIIKLNKNNTCGKIYNFITGIGFLFYFPKGDKGKGICQDTLLIGQAQYPASDFLQEEFTNGEQVEVRDDDLQEWEKGTFVVKYNGRYYCADKKFPAYLTYWKYCRKIPTLKQSVITKIKALMKAHEIKANEIL